MEVVILCGGKGTRMREYTEEVPKGLVEIGEYPILWHIMKYYSSFGFNEFVLCVGYKAEMIKKYFDEQKIGWKISYVNSGVEANKGTRVKAVKDHIKGDNFFLAYGDDVSDVNIKDLLEYHKKNNRIVTLTAINPESQFGILELNKENEVIAFKEKPPLDHWINGGFFVMNKKIFDHIKDGWDLEKETFEKLAKEKEIVAFKHKGFWKCMNTFKDNQELSELWNSGKTPWKKW